MKRVELRVTLPGQESADDALRAVAVLQRLLVMLGELETMSSTAPPGSRQDRSQWGFEELKLGSVVATLAPRKPRRGSSLMGMVETLHRAVDGLAQAEEVDGIPEGWNVPAAVAGVEFAKLLPPTATVPGLSLDLISDGNDVRRITVSNIAADHLSTGLRYRSRSIGSVMGRLESATLHQRREASLWPEHGIARVRIVFEARDIDVIRNAWGRRVEIRGVIERDHDGRIEKVKMSSLDVLRDYDSSPPLSDLIGLDVDLTGGLDPGAYLKKIRDAAE